MQSAGIATNEIGLGNKGISNIRFLNHSVSLDAEARAMNSVDIVESAIHVCFLEDHEMAHPP